MKGEKWGVKYLLIVQYIFCLELKRYMGLVLIEKVRTIQPGPFK